MTRFVITEDIGSSHLTVAWTIVHSDALVALSAVPNQLVDCWVTSPPYFRQVDYSVAGQYGLEDTVDEYFAKLRPVAREMLRCSTPGANLFWVVRDSSNGSGGAGGDFRSQDGSYRMKVRGANIKGCPRKAQLLIPEKTRIMFAEEGWIPIQSIIWDKGNGRRAAIDRPSYSYEQVLLFATRPTHYWNRDAVREFPALETTDTDQPGSRLKAVWQIPPGRQPRIEVNGKEIRGIASFPVFLAEVCIALGCPLNGIVMDPFCGYGSTIIAALKRGRHSIGIELNYETIQAATQRITETPLDRA